MSEIAKMIQEYKNRERPAKRKDPDLDCYDCKKKMVVTFKKHLVIKMNCPDRCKGQPELTFKDMGLLWFNYTGRENEL